MNSDAQAAREKVSRLEKLAPDQQASVLGAPGVVGSLADNGQGAQALALIARLTPDKQASVLAATDAARGLADNGQGEAVEDLQRGVAQWRTRMVRENRSSSPDR